MEICFTHQSLFQKQNEAKVCNFGDGVLFCAEVMHRGRGNVMLAFFSLGLLCQLPFRAVVCTESCVMAAVCVIV